jgi:hypothetical protein
MFPSSALKSSMSHVTDGVNLKSHYSTLCRAGGVRPKGGGGHIPEDERGENLNKKGPREE